MFGTIRNNNECIPGWNDFIKDFYAESRETFKAWKDSSCPRFGPVACCMRSSWANFEYVLRQCKLYEEDIRAMALSNKLQGGGGIVLIGEKFSVLAVVKKLVYQEELTMLWGGGGDHIITTERKV